MPASTKSNVPQHEVLKWNIAKASVEFGVSRDTLRKALNERSVAADSDGLYSTAGIVEGLYGSMHIERLKTQAEVTEKLRIQNMVSRGELLNKDALTRAFSELADALSSAVMLDRGLSRESKEAFLYNLSTWTVRLEGVAKRQTRFNGKRPEPEEDESE
jgi:hypothetical protein